MKFKRLISCGLIGIMAASLLAGCGSGSGDSGETATTEDGKIQIEYWYSGGKTAVDVLTNMIEEFNESQDTYEVVGTTQADYTETYEKLQAGIAGDNAPDVALIDVDKARNLSDKNLIADINPYVNLTEKIIWTCSMIRDWMRMENYLHFRHTGLHRYFIITLPHLKRQA